MIIKAAAAEAEKASNINILTGTQVTGIQAVSCGSGGGDDEAKQPLAGQPSQLPPIAQGGDRLGAGAPDRPVEAVVPVHGTFKNVDLQHEGLCYEIQIQPTDSSVAVQPDKHSATPGGGHTSEDPSVAKWKDPGVSKTSGSGDDSQSPASEPPARSEATSKLPVLADAVILATGGFAANRQLLRSLCPVPLADLPTSNGDWATGDGLLLGAALGAQLQHLSYVQVSGLAPSQLLTAYVYVFMVVYLIDFQKMLILEFTGLSVHMAWT